MSDKEKSSDTDKEEQEKQSGHRYHTRHRPVDKVYKQKPTGAPVPVTANKTLSRSPVSSESSEEGDKTIIGICLETAEAIARQAADKAAFLSEIESGQRDPPTIEEASAAGDSLLITKTSEAIQSEPLPSQPLSVDTVENPQSALQGISASLSNTNFPAHIPTSTPFPTVLELTVGSNPVEPSSGLSRVQSDPLIKAFFENTLNRSPVGYNSSQLLVSVSNQQLLALPEIGQSRKLANRHQLLPMGSTTIREAIESLQADVRTPKFQAPAIFDPTQGNAESFLVNFNRCADSNNWKEQHKICYLESHLTGVAINWYRTFKGAI